MSQHDLFGELRSATQQPDSAERWTRLVETISAWRDLDTFEEQAMPYLSEALATQDDDIDRIAPAAWVAGAQLHPALTLANGLDLTRSELDDAQIATLLASQELPALRALRLGHSAAGAEAMRALLASAHTATLRTLSLEGCKALAHHEPIEALAQAAFPALRSLDISNMECEVSVLEPLLRAPFLLQLEELSVLGNNAYDRDEIWHAFYEFMEATEHVAPGEEDYFYGDDDYDDEPGEEADEGAEPEALPEGETLTDLDRLRALRLSVEQQVLTWATDITPDRYFEYFHDLME